MSGNLAALVRDAAAARPDAIAVIDGDRVFTYGWLDERAAAIADGLVAAGVVPGDRVALYLPKSAEAIAALHGVLRVGAAYVPLDPKGPAPRLAAILADAEPTALITTPSMSTRLDALTAAGVTLAPIVLAVEGDLTLGDGTLAHPLGEAGDVDLRPTEEPAPAPEDLAYVLYTSGSTGTPKGVMLTHHNALAFVSWAVEATGLHAGDRLSGHAPLHFDLSIFDIFASAMVGAALVLVPARALVFPADAVSFVEANEVSVWYSVPSALALMATKGGLVPGCLPSLRTIVFAGEVFPPQLLAQLMHAVPHATYWNWYGPTETNVCTAHHVRAVPDPDDPPVPIGRPIAATTARVVDDDGNDVADGTAGELLIGGPTVAAGYWRAPELTSQRFSETDGVRWYRTGDVVTRDPDQTLRFVGRRDDQVKSRGHRIELGEVQSALLRQEGVVDAAVVAVPDALVTNRLHAFVVVEPPGSRDAANVQTEAARALPAAMVPEEVHMLESLPRTSTGKVDRQALLRHLEAS